MEKMEKQILKEYHSRKATRKENLASIIKNGEEGYGDQRFKKRRMKLLKYVRR